MLSARVQLFVLDIPEFPCQFHHQIFTQMEMCHMGWLSCVEHVIQVTMNYISTVLS